ncbi:hypothetical protein ES707_19623 [subsurface metagenome]
MPTYTDPISTCLPNPKWPWNHVSHLLADDLPTLHHFAQSIGLKRSWFQNKSTFPHYDLTPNKHKQAIAAGAILLTGKSLLTKFQQLRSTYQHPPQ